MHMADPAPTGTVVPVTPASSGDGSTTPEFKVPEGKVLIDASEHQTWQRQREQLAGLTRFQGEAAKVGIKRPDDFGRIAKFNQWLETTGLTLEQLTQAKREDDAQTGSDTGLDPRALEKWAKEQGFVRSADLDTREQKIHATAAHKEALSRESSAVESFVKQLLGESPTERDRRALKAIVKETLEEKRGTYPDGHPLADSELAAFDEKGLAPIFEEVKKFWAVGQGEEMAQQGDAALKGKVTSPAGATTKTPTKTTKEVEMRPGGRFPVSTIEASAAKKQAARGGKPVSTLGG
jgi:hypothetical protein